MRRFASAPRVQATPGTFVSLFAGGLVMLVAMLIWPKTFYPFVLTSLVFVVEPLTYWTGRRYFLRELRAGGWRVVIALLLGAVTCGLCWVLWYYYSFPRWRYVI